MQAPIDYTKAVAQFETKQPFAEEQEREDIPPFEKAAVPTQPDSEIPDSTRSHTRNASPDYVEPESSHVEESLQARNPEDPFDVSHNADKLECYNKDIQQSPLTAIIAIDSSSAIGDTQELALLVELDNQLVKHSPVVRQSCASVIPHIVTPQDTPPGETYVHEIDGRLKKDLIDEIIMQDAGTFVGSIDETAALIQLMWNI